MNAESQQQEQSMLASNVGNTSRITARISSQPSVMTASTVGNNPGQPGSMTVMANATVTLTITEAEDSATSRQNETPVLLLSLAPRPTVRWDESTLDNEGLGRKSSKRCCIFHKQRNFGESSSDSEESDGNQDDGNDKKVARPKKGKNKIPDYQRFHA